MSDQTNAPILPGVTLAGVGTVSTVPADVLLAQELLPAGDGWIPVAAPAPVSYRHGACGTITLAGSYTKDSAEMPCPTCGSCPVQKDFTWE